MRINDHGDEVETGPHARLTSREVRTGGLGVGRRWGNKSGHPPCTAGFPCRARCVIGLAILGNFCDKSGHLWLNSLSGVSELVAPIHHTSSSPPGAVLAWEPSGSSSMAFPCSSTLLRPRCLPISASRARHSFLRCPYLPQWWHVPSNLSLIPI